MVKMKKAIATNNAPGAIGPYSQALAANGFLFISGQMPVNPATGNVVDGGITEQTEMVMKNLEAILKEAGCTFDNVVKSTCYLSDIANFGAMNAVYGKYFKQDLPDPAHSSDVRRCPRVSYECSFHSHWVEPTPLRLPRAARQGT